MAFRFVRTCKECRISILSEDELESESCPLCGMNCPSRSVYSRGVLSLKKGSSRNSEPDIEPLKKSEVEVEGTCRLCSFSFASIPLRIGSITAVVCEECLSKLNVVKTKVYLWEDKLNESLDRNI